jgi:predicted nucleotidyltransferase
MKNSARRFRRSKNPLAGMLASDALAKLSTQFVLWPGAALHFQALKRATGLPNRSLQNELARLERLGLLRREPDGRFVRYRAQTAHPGWQAVRALVAAFADPADVVHAAIAPVPGVDAAFIYGSYAGGTNIHPASDVDVMVIGEHVDDPETRSSLAGSALEAAGLVGREVNLVRYTPSRLRDRYARGGRFLRGVLDGPKRWLVGNDHALTGHLRTVTRGRHGGVAADSRATRGRPT